MTEPVRADASGRGTPKRARGLAAGLALAAGSLVVFATGLELFGYFAKSEIPSRLTEEFPLAVSGLEVPDPVLFWRHRPNADLMWKGIRFTTNAFGLRDRERSREKPPGVFRILSLGESTTFGEKLEVRENYSYVLEEILNADSSLGCRVEVWNCGKGSYTTFQSLRWLERDGFGFAPDLVLFYHEANDFLPTYHRTGDGEALGLGRTDRQLGALSRRLGPLTTLLEKSHFYRWMRIRVLLAASRAVGQAMRRPDRDPAKIRRPTTEYGPALKMRMPWGRMPVIAADALADPRAWPDTLPYMDNMNPLCRVPDGDREELLGELVRLTRSRGVDLVLIHPAYEPSRPHRCALTELAARDSVALVDFERVLHASGRSRSDVFIDMFHPKAVGHRLLAEALARALGPRIQSATAG